MIDAGRLMNRLRTVGFFLWVVAWSAAISSAQSSAPSTARVVARSGIVEIQRANAWVTASPGDQLASGARIRTGSSSSAAIELGPGKIITLSERTEVQIRQANGAASVQLETGNMKVVSASDIQVAAKDTTLESVEKPLDMELGYQTGRLNLTVISGAVWNGQVTIHGQQDSNTRTFTADGRWSRDGNAVVYPGVYFYPYVVYGNAGSLPQQQGPVGTVPPQVLNPTHPAYRPDQIVPPMTDPLRVPVQRSRP